MLKIRGLKKLFREKYEFRISIRKFCDLGMRMAVRFKEEALEYYGKIFRMVDVDGSGFIDFYEFENVIKRVDSSRASWKIHAIFQ